MIEPNIDALEVEGLLLALKRLDLLLARAVAAGPSAFGQATATDPFRGLYINRDQAERLLTRDPGQPLFGQTAGSQAPQASNSNKQEQKRKSGRFPFFGVFSRARTEEDIEPRIASPAAGDELTPDNRASNGSETHNPAVNSPKLAWLQRTFGLTDFDLDVIIIALAPEIDRRYEQVYAYLQDHVSRRRPSVDLTLDLLCASPIGKLTRRRHFALDAPLIQHHLIHLTQDTTVEQPSLLTSNLKLDEQITRFMLGQPGIDTRLASFCRLVQPRVSIHSSPLANDQKKALFRLVQEFWESGRPLRLYFHGPNGAGKSQVAEALAAAIGAPMLAVNLAKIGSTQLERELALKLVFREAGFQKALLYVDGLDTIRDVEPTLLFEQLPNVMMRDASVTVLAGTRAWTPAGRVPTDLIVIPFPVPDFAQRRAHWQNSLAGMGITLDEDNLTALADRFRLTPNQIVSAVATAVSYSHWRAACLPEEPDVPVPSLADLFAAARAQSGHDLANLAHKINPIYTWDDIVLPEDSLAQLHEICQRVTYRYQVLGRWGFDNKLSYGKGINALFAGPSGTGKTMAAEVIAHKLSLDLYKIDLSGVVSKYIGETEKNLDRIFSAAESANAILFFDEADALFGKRSEVRDSHDRYANIEISYLLQKMEEYDGITILATNLRQNLDEAFVRRMAFSVHFPFPDEESRLLIWQGIWPDETPLAEDVDLGLLAHGFRLTGGNIRNIALAAAFLAAEDGNEVTRVHLVRAIRREYQKMGKMLSDAELEPLETAVSGHTINANG